MTLLPLSSLRHDGAAASRAELLLQIAPCAWRSRGSSPLRARAMVVTVKAKLEWRRTAPGWGSTPEPEGSAESASSGSRRASRRRGAAGSGFHGSCLHSAGPGGRARPAAAGGAPRAVSLSAWQQTEQRKATSGRHTSSFAWRLRPLCIVEACTLPNLEPPEQTGSPIWRPPSAHDVSEPFAPSAMYVYFYLQMHTMNKFTAYHSS